MVQTTPDDAAYFFKVAENIASGRGPTFDGINRTNGFQPLWTAILVPFNMLIRGTPETMMRIYFILQLVLFTSSWLIVYSLLSQFFTRKVSLISGMLYLNVARYVLNGMESSLLVFMLAVLFYYGWRKNILGSPKAGQAFGFGMALGLVVLSRLDMVFLMITVLALSSFRLIGNRSLRKHNFKKTAAIFLGSFLVVGPYLMYNYITFGSVMPISGALKSSFPNISFAFYFGRLELLCLLISLGYLVWFIKNHISSKRSSYELNYFRISMTVMSITILLHFLHSVLFMKWAVMGWHYFSYLPFLSIVLSEAIDYFSSRDRFPGFRYLYWIGLVTILAFTGYKIYQKTLTPIGKNWRVVSYNSAVWTRDNTPETAVFAMKDSGNFGYFCRRRVINLDGVVNNMDYQDVIRDKKLNEYFNNNGVQYLAQHAFHGPGDKNIILQAFGGNRDVNSGDYEWLSLRYRSQKYLTYSDEISLRKTDEIYRSDTYYDGTRKTAFVIWKIS